MNSSLIESFPPFKSLKLKKFKQRMFGQKRPSQLGYFRMTAFVASLSAILITSTLVGCGVALGNAFAPLESRVPMPHENMMQTLQNPQVVFNEEAPRGTYLAAILSRGTYDTSLGTVDPILPPDPLSDAWQSAGMAPVPQTPSRKIASLSQPTRAKRFPKTSKPNLQEKLATAPAIQGLHALEYPVKNYRISSGFGWRGRHHHDGVDIPAPIGTHINAAEAGTVVEEGWESGYGHMLIIDHGNGLRTRYAHCSRVLVKLGETIQKGQHVADVGATGRVSGAHLHFEVLVSGHPQNPKQYF